MIDSLTLDRNSPLRYFTFFYLYVMQGVPAGFALTAVANYLTGKGADPAAVGTFVAVVGLPWVAQFVWGPVIDRFQRSAMGRRRPWVLLAQLFAFVASLGVLFVEDPLAQTAALTLAFCVHSVFASVQDASVDAMAISVIKVSERGRINALMRGGWLVGVGVGAAGFAYLLSRYGFTFAALTQSLVLLAFTVVTFFIRERAEDALLSFRSIAPDEKRSSPDGAGRSADSLAAIFAELFRGLFSANNLVVFASIALVYACLSVFRHAYSFHLIRNLGWADTSLSVMAGTYGTLIALAIVLLGGTLADKVGTRRWLIAMMCVIGGFLLVFNLIAAEWVRPQVATAGLVVYTMFDPGFSVAALPVLMALCRPGVEGSQFTTYMALVNLCDIAGAYVAGHAFAWLPVSSIGFCCVAGVAAAVIGVNLSRDSERFEAAAPVNA